MKITKIILLFVLCLLWQSLAFAYEHTYAVVVGVAKYQISSNNLNYAASDADKFRVFLMSPAGGNVPAENICLLKNEKATKSNIQYYAKRLFAKAKANDRVIFFFSGHGTKNGLYPHDVNFFGENVLLYEELKELLRATEAHTKLVFVDACQAGGIVNSRSGSTSPQKNNSFDGYDIAFMQSSESYQTSRESQVLQHGVFTYFLIKGLTGEADKNGNSKITIGELFDYVYKKTKNYSEGTQTPVMYGNFDVRLIVGYRR